MHNNCWNMYDFLCWTVFLWLFFCLSVSLSGRRIYPVCLIFGINIYVIIKKKMLYEISRILFGVQCINSACTRVHKIILMYYDLCSIILLNQFQHGYCLWHFMNYTILLILWIILLFGCSVEQFASKIVAHCQNCTYL